MNKKGINARLLESKMSLRGYDRKDFAKALGVTPHSVTNLLNGRHSPSHDMMNKIYVELDLTPDEATAIFFNSNLRETKV